MSQVTQSRGWKKTPEGKMPRNERMQQIVSEILAKKSFKAIAEQFQISVARVSAIRRQAGIERRIKPAE